MSNLTRILHVDDDEDIRTIANLALEMVGNFELMQCASGSEAIAQIAEFAPDLVLLDYMMPVMNGGETLNEIRKIPGYADVPSVFMTARLQEELVQELLDKGAWGVIRKPFDPMTLADDIRAIWAKGPAKVPEPQF